MNTALQEAIRAEKREHARKWRAENKEKVRQYAANWRANNKEKVRESNQKYWEKRAAKRLQEKESMNEQ